MKRTEQTFELTLNTNITAKIAMEHSRHLSKLFNTRVKLEKAYKRKVERLTDAAEDVVKLTNVLINKDQIREFADAQVESHEAFLYLFAELDMDQRGKVYEFIMGLKKQEAEL